MRQSAIAPGLLLAMPQLDDPNFDRAVVLMIQHSDKGSFGLVLNRPSETPVIDVTAPLGMRWRGDPEARIWSGGPVSPESGWLLHEPAVALEADGTLEVCEGIALSTSPANFKRLVESPPRRMRFFAGYAGWGSHQLESELRRARGSRPRSRPSSSSTRRPSACGTWRCARSGSSRARSFPARVCTIAEQSPQRRLELGIAERKAGRRELRAAHARAAEQHLVGHLRAEREAQQCSGHAEERGPAQRGREHARQLGVRDRRRRDHVQRARERRRRERVLQRGDEILARDPRDVLASAPDPAAEAEPELQRDRRERAAVAGRARSRSARSPPAGPRRARARRRAPTRRRGRRGSPVPAGLVSSTHSLPRSP